MLNVSEVLAEEPELSLSPNSGTIEFGKDSAIDVLVDTKGQEVVLVRAAITFDPSLIQVEQAQRNEDIFCTWPAGEQLVDNERGIVVATGFCQSGVDDLYATIGEADVFVRLTFSTKKQGAFTLGWEYTGRDEPMNSVIVVDGSPPQNILNFKPASGDYIVKPSESNPVPPTTIPDTGLPVFENISLTFLLGFSVFLLALVVNILLDPKRRYFSKSRTIVVYDDEEEN